MESITVQGERVPALGLGTWGLQGQGCQQAVSEALECGYRRIDTARAYENERDIGLALADSPLDRDELFLTTKVRGADASASQVLDSVEASLHQLGVSTIDLVLLHWPNPVVEIEETLGALAELRERSAIRHIGVSNFSLERLQKARAAIDVPIFANQVQFHPFKPRHDMVGYCQENDMMLTAFSPLVHGGATGDSVLAEVGRQYGKSGSQVAIRWALQHENVAVIPKASSREHLLENVAVFDFRLSAADLQRIERPSRLRTGIYWARGRLGV